MLTVTAIIPCFNAEAHLAQAIRSVRRQTRPVEEIIVVDDGSTDASVRIAVEGGATVIRQPENRGVAAARNAGIRAAGGELIAWLDADDFWEPHHVATVAALLDRYPAAAAAFGAVRRFGSRDGVVAGYAPEGEPSNVFWCAFDDWLHPPTGSVVRREVLQQLGGFAEEERYATDYDLWLRLARMHQVVATREITSNWRWHSEQLSSAPDRQIRAVYGFRRKLWEELRRSGEAGTADRVAMRARHLLRTELHRARFVHDRARLRFLASLIPLVPGYPLPARLKWAARARSLAPLAPADVRGSRP